MLFASLWFSGSFLTILSPDFPSIYFLLLPALEQIFRQGSSEQLQGYSEHQRLRRRGQQPAAEVRPLPVKPGRKHRRPLRRELRTRRFIRGFVSFRFVLHPISFALLLRSISHDFEPLQSTTYFQLALEQIVRRGSLVQGCLVVAFAG